MPIRVQYNADVRFRRVAAFRNFYRARDSRLRCAAEIGVALISAVICVILWNSHSTSRIADICFYAFGLLGIFLLGRVIRCLLSVWRIKPLSGFQANREFHFFDNGFRFGPTDEMGTMIETRWREVDHAYQVDRVVYLLCKNKTNWAPVDLNKVIEGDPDKLLDTLRYNIPGKRWSKR